VFSAFEVGEAGANNRPSSDEPTPVESDAGGLAAAWSVVGSVQSFWLESCALEIGYNRRMQPSRLRARVFCWLVLLIAVGLGSRRLGELPSWITLYAGDVAWGAMFFVLFCAVRPTLSTARAWLAAVVTTENTAPQRKAIHSARAPKTQLSAPHQAQDQSPQLEKPAAKP